MIDFSVCRGAVATETAQKQWKMKGFSVSRGAVATENAQKLRENG